MSRAGSDFLLAQLGGHGLVRGSFLARTLGSSCAVASDMTGVSGRAMLHALIKGKQNPAVLADLAKHRLRAKTEFVKMVETSRS